MITIKQYRDKWLAEKADEFIGFYNREFFCLDNFSSFGFVYDRHRFAYGRAGSIGGRCFALFDTADVFGG